MGESFGLNIKAGSQAEGIWENGGKEAVGSVIELQNEKLQNFYPSSSIMKVRKMR
jgi:hypothetical protein